MEILNSYLEDLTLAAAQKVFLVSDEIGSSTEVLSRLSRSNRVNKPTLLTIVPHSKPNHQLKEYVRHRRQGSQTGLQSIDKMIADFQKQCAPAGTCNFENETDFGQQMIEAVVSFLAAFKSTHSKHCGNVSGVCEVLSDSDLFYSEIFDQIHHLDLDTKVANQTVEVRYKSNGDIVNNNNEPAFHLTLATNWKYEVLGTYFYNRTWQYYEHPISLLPENSSFRCKTNCAHCTKNRDPYVYIRGKSKYIIGYTSPVSVKEGMHSCGPDVSINGFVTMQSFYYAVQQIKNITGIDFSTLFIDTCDGSLGSHKILNSIFKSESSAVLNDPQGNEHHVDPNDFVVFLGDTSSGVSIVLQTYLNLYKIPQISSRSTSTWLSDRLWHPTFLRNVPNDEEQAKFIVKLVLENGWNNTGLIHDTTVYGKTGAQMIEKHAKANGVCISFRMAAQNSNDELQAMALNISRLARTNKLLRPIIIFAENIFIRNLIKKISKHVPDWKARGIILIGGETWGNRLDVIDGFQDFAYGSLTFSLKDDLYTWTRKGKNYFKDFLHNQKPTNNENNSVFIHFWQQYFNCFLPNSYHPAAAKDAPCDINSQFLSQPGFNGEYLDFENVVGKHNVMNGLVVAYAIRNATKESYCYRESDSINCSRLFKNSTVKMHFLELLHKTKIPTFVNSNAQVYSPFLSTGDGKVNYKIYNIVKSGNQAVYKHVYSVTNGELKQEAKTVYYIGGEIDPNNVTASCPSSQCSCTLLNQVSNRSGDGETEKLDKDESSKWVLPIVIVMLTSLTVLLAVAIAYTGYTFRTVKHKDINSKVNQVELTGMFIVLLRILNKVHYSRHLQLLDSE